MSSEELSEWVAFYGIEPFGEERADLRSAIVAREVYNGQRRKQDWLKVQDFMPFIERRRKSAEEMKATFFAAVKGNLMKQKKDASK